MPLPTSIELGVPPAGMRVVVPFTAHVDPSSLLELWVSTSRLSDPGAFEFRVADIPSGAVLFAGHAFRSRAAFEAEAFTIWPCHDESGRHLRSLVQRWWLISTAVFLAVGLALLLVDRRARPRPD